MLGSVRTPGPCVWNRPLAAQDLNLEVLISGVCTELPLISMIMISRGKRTDGRKTSDITLFPVGLGRKDRTWVGNTPDA